MGSWSLIIATAVVCLIYKLSTIFYDVYLGPMSKFPGPKLWAATALPYTIKLWRGEEALAKHALHDKYGPVVRVSPAELSYCNGSAWKDIYGHRTAASKKSFQKVKSDASSHSSERSVRYLNS